MPNYSMPNYSMPFLKIVSTELKEQLSKLFSKKEDLVSAEKFYDQYINLSI
jgi:hypothetical protein